MKTLLCLILIVLLFQFMTGWLLIMLSTIALWELLKGTYRVVTDYRVKFFWKEIFNA